MRPLRFVQRQHEIRVQRRRVSELLVQSRRRRRIPFFASHGSNRRHHRREMEFMFNAAHAPMKPVYTRLAYQSRDLRLAGLLFSQRVVA
jgi:hypothetical protein